MFQLESPDEILAAHTETIASIRQSAGISDDLFDRLYLRSISKAAGLMQSCPATEGGHHSWPGGLFGYSLESGAYTLRLRKGKIMPVGASPEQESRKEDLYTYAVFHAALLHEIGVTMDNLRIALYDRRRQFLTEWRPLHEDWTDHPRARHMKIEFRQEPVNHRRPVSSLMYVSRILDGEGCSWLQGDPDVYNDFLNAFGDRPCGSIHQLVAMASRISRDRGTGSGSVTTAPVSNGSDFTPVSSVEVTQPVQETVAPLIEPESGHEAGESGTGDGQKGDSGAGRVVSENQDSEEAPRPGEAFRKWVESGISSATLDVNGKSAVVHVGRVNLFLVVPGIFVTYAAGSSMDWETEQRHFLSLEIHTKNGEKDWWHARLQIAGKMEKIKGLVVPTECFELPPELPVNKHLTVLRKLG